MQAFKCLDRLTLRPSSGREDRKSDPIARWFLVVVAAGILWRLLRFGLNFEITGDESGILLSVAERGYAGLLLPLSYSNVSPPLFLWTTKFIDSLFPNEWAVRSLPFLASLGAVTMFGLICREVLEGKARWVAWAVFSVSFVPISEGTRVKGYAIDLFVATLMLWLTVRWLLCGRQVRYLIWLGLCAPVFIWLSYTAVFIVGAAALTFTGCLVETCFHKGGPDRANKPAWPNIAAGIAFMAFAGVSAILLYEKNIRAGLGASVANGLSDAWKQGYPPVQWGSIPLWLLSVHTGRGFAWPAGDNHFASSVTFALWLAGLAAYWRRGNRWVWMLFVAPQVLGLAAGFWHKYPYLQNPRICMYLGPGICLFVGQGAQWLIERLNEEKRGQCYRFLALALTFLAVGGMGWEITRRVREFTGPGIRRTLVEASQRVHDDAYVIVLNKSSNSGIFNYYFQRKLAVPRGIHRVIPDPIASDAELTLMVVTNRTAPADSDGLFHDFERRLGKPLKVEWTGIAHQVLDDNRDGVVVWICDPRTGRNDH